MTSRERVLKALSMEFVDRVPYIELLFDQRVAAGIAGGLEKLTANQSAIQTLTAVKRRSLDYQIAYSQIEPDISRLVHRDNISYWGALAPFECGDSYLLDPRTPELGVSSDGIIKTRQDLDKMVFRKLDDEFWAPAKAFLDNNKEDFAANAIVWLGIDPAWHSMGFEHFSICLATDPGFVEEVLARICEWCAQVAEGLCTIGFDFIWAADDIAFKSSTLFSPEMYREILLPHTKTVAKKILIPWAYHSDGNLLPVLDDMLTQGMHAIHPLEPGSMDLKELKQTYGKRIALVGNIDMDRLARGTPQEIRQEVKDRIALLGPGYGYLVSSSNTISEWCKPENVLAMVDAIEEFGHYPLGEL